MRIDEIHTIDQLSKFFQSKIYWFLGFEGKLESLPRDEFTFKVHVSNDGSVKVEVLLNRMFIGEFMDLSDCPEDVGK